MTGVAMDGWMGSGSSKRVSVFVLGEEEEEGQVSGQSITAAAGGPRTIPERSVFPLLTLLCWLLNISSALSASDHSQKIHK